MDAKEEIRLAAQLAKMALTPEEAKTLSEGWSAYVPLLEALAEHAPDTAPMWYPHENPTPMREDEVQPSLERDALLANAPVATDGCFVVPRLVE